MHTIIVKRLLNTIPLLLLISLLSFMLMQLAPGDPVQMYLSTDLRQADPEAVARVRAELGLDRPLHVQYVSWLTHALQGDLGFSLRTRQPVTEVIGDVLPNSLLLAALSLPLAVILGIALGILTAVKQRSLLDYAVTGVVFVGYSIPSFYLALLALYVFSFRLQWLPSSGMRTLRGASHSPAVDVLLHAAMPVFVYTVVRLVVWVRFQRNSFIEEIGRDYIRTARAKGLKEHTVLLRHAWRNSLIPIVTQLGLSFSSLVGGSFIIESIFAWPGMGRLGVESIQFRDFPVTLGILLISSSMIVFGNLLSDIVYHIVDPRINLEAYGQR